PGSGFTWYDQLTKVLGDHGLTPPHGATPKEAAAAAASALAVNPGTAAVADVPPEVTRAFYLARYADRPPTPPEAAELAAAVERLRAAPRGRRRPPGPRAPPPPE